MDNPVSQAYCKEHSKLYDERFERDMRDIARHEDSIQEMQKLTIQISELIKQNNETIKDHTKRLVELEKKPSKWVDKFLSALISAGIAAVIAILGGTK